ncbi:hypothetical protein BV898_05050 [Hypsibius exemplaris]|uniref:Thyroglobulin type-1 domain-containing protein n=1 Tax=Hypsibius exemplaris TaxID=2072580 RepID=A0A1W0X0H8_HYPEX|nr:hypothetical protein BV898_05050 [Hypsibius exemplaris]
MKLLSSFLLVACCLLATGLRMTIAQPPLPDNTCQAYRQLALNPNSNLTGVVTSGGPGFSSKIETPSYSVWIPMCDQAGLYVPLQTRQNFQQFCVLPRTGEIAFDPASQGRTGSGSSTLFCQCFVARQTVVSGHFRDFMPDCDATTGLYKLVQRYPSGKMQCYSPTGNIISEQFDPSQIVQLPASCY